MKRYYVMLYVIVLIVFSFASVSKAQKVTSEPQMQMNKDESSRRDKMRAMVIWKLIEYLDIDEDQSAQILPILKETSEARYKLIKEHRGIIRKISENVDDKEVSIKELNKDVEKLEKLNEEMIKIRKEFIEKSEKYLDERQYIKLKIFEDRLKADLFRRYRDRRKEHSGKVDDDMHKIQEPLR